MNTYSLGPFLGVNNRLPDFALHIATRQVQGDYVRAAVNVDIDNSGNLLLRKAPSLVQALTDAHSLHMISDTAGYIVIGSALYAITLPTYTQALVTALASTAPMSYVEYDGSLYYSNGTDSGRITAGVRYPLGLPTPATPTVSAIGGSLPAGWYQIGLAYYNATTGEEGGVGPSSNNELTTDGGLRATLPAAVAGATHINVYLSATNSGVPRLATSVAVGTTFVDLTTLAVGREALQRYEAPLPAGRLFLSNGRLCSYSGDTVYLGLPYRPGYYLPSEGFMRFPTEVSVAVDAQQGFFVAADKTYWVPTEGPVADVLPYGAVPGTEFSLPNKSIYGWFGLQGLVFGKTSGEVEAVMSDNIELTSVPDSGTSMLIDDEYRRVVSCGWCVNAANRAATRYEGWGLTSYSRGYGTTEEGLCVLADAPVLWSIDLGKQNFGNEQEKHLPAVYLGVTTEDRLQITVNDDYTYPTRGAGDGEHNVQRIDVGRGLRANWFHLVLSGDMNLPFRMSSIDFVPATTKRRI